MARVLPLSDVKARLSEVIDEIASTHERVTVTRNGRPVAVLVSTDDLDAIEETLSILSDPATMAEIDAARRALDAGDAMTRSDLDTLRDRLRDGGH